MSLSEQPLQGLPRPLRLLLPGRGSTTVWDSGQQNAEEPPLLLLHGWNIDAPANFGHAFTALANDHRVVMFDHHGHGEGIRPTARFALESAATDALLVLDALGIEQAIVVGYSMGGAIAQLLAKAAPDRCSGVVLIATADRFSESRRERRQFAAFSSGARILQRLPTPATTKVFERIATAACAKYPDWILETVKRADPVALLDAGAALGSFDSSPWNPTLAPPVAFVLTTRDTVVPPRRQIRLATSLDVVHLRSIDADHDLPIRNDPRFAIAITDAALAVAAAEHSSLGRSHSCVDLAH